MQVLRWTMVLGVAGSLCGAAPCDADAAPGRLAPEREQSQDAPEPDELPAEPEPSEPSEEPSEPPGEHAGLVVELPSEPASEPVEKPTTATVEPPPAAPIVPVAPPRRPAVEPRSPVRVRPVLDVTLTLAAAAPGLGLGLWVEPSLPNSQPALGARADVARIDRIALDRFASAPATASDVLLSASVAAPFVYHAIEAGLRRRGFSRIRGRGFLVRYGTDALLLAQALAVNGLLTQVLKTAIRRPRPYTYTDPATVDPDLREELVSAQMDNQADWSFPSGHTSTAFTVATAGATLLTLELLGRSRWGIATAWVGGLGLAAGTGILRVAAGRHFPSDTITSALLGMGVGAAIPLAHWRPARSGDYVDRPRRDREPRRWALAPTSGAGRGGVVLVVSLP